MMVFFSALSAAPRVSTKNMHDLDDAMARGYTDIESLKRYTGFGTGWCQGKWCVALCAQRLVERGERRSADHAAPPGAPDCAS